MSACSSDQPFGNQNPTPEGTTNPPGWAVALARFTKATPGGYSIRVATSPGSPCAQCGEPTGIGPIGCLDEEPVCDLCLLNGCHELGMVLAVIAVARAYASIDPTLVIERQEALEELGAFVRVYERFAAKLGPPRRFGIPPLEDGSEAH